MANSSDNHESLLSTTWPPVLDPGSAAGTAVLNPIELGKELALLPHPQWPWGDLQEIRVELRTTHPEGHRVFEIFLSARGGFHRLIGKVYATDRKDVYEVMEQVRQAGFEPESEFSIPRPIAYLPSLRLLLQERVAGTSAKKFFRFGVEGQRAAAAERCAGWLARFHTVAPAAGRVLTVPKILKNCRHKHELICRELGQLGARSEELVERLQAAAGSLAPIPVCPGHGDYGTFQIIFGDNGRVAVFDWDLYDVADPTRDLSRFVISLERHARGLGSVRALDGTAEVFLETYVRAGGHPQVRVNLPFYKAAGYMRAATWKIKTKELAWRERAEGLLDDALSALGN